MKVKFCPFCGHHGHELLHSTVDVRYEDGEHEIRDIWQMECKCCGARGPTEYEPRFAIESWNTIHKSLAHKDDPMEEDFAFNPNSIKGKDKPYGKEKDNQGQQGQSSRD